MMNTFFQRAFTEYKRQKKLKKAFTTHTGRVGSILRKVGPKTASAKRLGRESEHFHGHAGLVLLTPLIEIAWADGRVSRREMEVIAQAADAYQLVKDEWGYRELIERLMSRPAPLAVGRMWQELGFLMESLTEGDRETVCTALLAQTGFIAEQGPDGILAFLRGERIRLDEKEALQITAVLVEKARNAAVEADIKRYVSAQIEKEKLYETAQHEPPAVAEMEQPIRSERKDKVLDETRRQAMVNTLRTVEAKMFRSRALELSRTKREGAVTSDGIKPIALLDDSDKLIPLVPLVKVAWAEGRITRRERELIFSAAERMGIEAGTPSHERLASWLELHPTENFFRDSLDHLNSAWSNLSADEKNLRRLDVISDCVNVAEASGGTMTYAAGGRLVCDEEFSAVKGIAEKLKPAAADGSPLI